MPDPTIADVSASVKALGDSLLPTLEKMSKTPASKATAGDDSALPARLFATPRNKTTEDMGGFANLGEFALAVKQAGPDPQTGGQGDRWNSYRQKLFKGSDELIRTKAITGLGELIGAEAGVLVPPQFSNTIFERVYSDAGLWNQTDSYTTSGNSMSFPRNAETSRATGSRWGGVRAYWTAEGGQGTTSKPSFGRLRLELHKLFVLIYATEELLSDTSGVTLEQYLTRVATSEILFLTNDAVVRGTGAGMPVGILDASETDGAHTSVIAVAKESGQGAATILSANIDKMWSRMKADSRDRATWYINQDVEPQLETLSRDVGTGGLPVYLPPGGLTDSPNARLKGRPVKIIEQCSTLGTVGDIMLLDLSQYLTLNKGGIEAAMSMHLRFDFQEQAFRWIFRADGQPWWPSKLTPFQGSATQSWATVLATRA